MCDCFHIAFPNWHAASSGTGAGRRLRGPEPGTEDNSICDEASQFTEGERPRPQGSSPIEEFPEPDKYGDSDKECEAEHDPYHKSGKKAKKSGLGSIFDKRSTPKMSKLKEAPSPEAGVIVKTAKDGCAEGLVYGGGGKDGLFIKEVVPESPASKNLHLKEGDQVLSATVYFDNIPYDDAIQILEHAQAYKVKLCLKRKPEITETEGAIDSDAIPEDEVHAPEMREPGKKRRGDARISWPKFPTLGRGKKSRFTRSHSSSEADEQRKLELSPTTSDTESPIKSQDALKGKKKHKIKLPGLKRGRISSSEDTDAPNVHTEEMLSPECLESPSRETQEGDAVEELEKNEDVKDGESETETHKAELVCLDSTLKTTDITAALVEEETPSATASPDGKKKKKERSELKLKILGRDKKHKAKSSPKRLKTLGASLDKADDKENEKSDAVPSSETEQVTTDSQDPKMSSSKSSQMELRLPKVEIDISDVGIMCKSTHAGDKKGKSAELKQQAKAGFKLPKVGLGDIATEEIIKIDAIVEESKTKEKDDAYDRLLKGTQLPKREDIEIPGMEDVSKITKDFKEPRAPLATISDAELQAETVQMSIDVDSVKEAVSKLPGYKLPKVDMSGVPIPEEITVIDANAQRISVKTPTKAKHESKSETTAFTEISRMTVKLPHVTADLKGGEIISETKVGVKKAEWESKDVTISTKAIISQTIEIEKVQGKENIKYTSESVETQKELDKKTKMPKATMPNFGISKPDIKFPEFGIDLTTQSEKKDDKVHGKRTIFLQEGKIDVKLPDVKISPIKGGFEIPSKDFDAKLKLESEEQKDISVSVGGVEIKTHEKQEKGGKLKMPNVGISMPTVKGGKSPEMDLTVPGEILGSIHVSIPEVDVEKPKLEIKSQQTDQAKFGIKMKGPELSLSKKVIDVTLPEAKVEVDVPKLPDSQPTGDLETQEGKFKLPKLGLKMPKMKGPEFDLIVSKKDVDVTLPDIKAKVDLPEVPDVTSRGEVSLPAQKVDVKKPEMEIKAQSIEGDFEGQGGKLRMPSIGVKLPRAPIKGHEFDISLSKKDGEVSLPKGKVKVELPDAPKVDVTLGKISVSSPEKKTDVKIEGEVDGQGSKFKMPKLGITMPKMKGPEIDINLSKEDIETSLPEVKADIKVPDVKLKEPSAKADISTPEIGDVRVKAEAEIDIADPSLSVKTTASEIDAKAGKFKMPKFGISMPKVKGPEIDLSLSKKDKGVKPVDIKAEVKVPEVDMGVGKVDVPEAKTEIEKTSIGAKSLEANAELEGQSGKFKIPRFAISIPKVKGPEIDLSLQTKDVDVALPEAKIEVEQPMATKIDVEVKPPEIHAELEGGKFKLPKFGIKMPKVKGPEIDLSLPKKDIKSPEIKADINLPEVPKVDVSLGDVDVKIPEAKIEVEKPKVPDVDVKQPTGKIKIKAPDIDVSVTEDSPSKFKMPSLGFSVPKMKAPDVDLSLSKKDVDVRLPEVKPEVTLPELESKEISAKMEVKTPDGEVSTRGSPLKFKMPTFKLPKFGGSIEEKDTDIKIDAADMTVSVPQKDIDIPEVKGEVNLPEVEVKVPSGEIVLEQPSGLEIDAKFKKPKFSLPRFSFSKQSVQAPEVDVSAPEVDIPQQEGKVEVKREIDVKAPEVETQIEGQGSKFKLPKFGIAMPKISAPEIDLSVSKKDVEVKVEDKLPDVEVKAPSVEVEIKAPEIKVETKTKEGSPSKLKMPTFKLPKFGVSIPEAEIKVDGNDVNVSVPQADVDLPEVKADVQLPELEVKAPLGEVVIEQPSGLEIDAKFKKPRFSLPRFSFSKQSVQAPEVDVRAPEVNIPQQEGEVEVKGEIDVKVPEHEAQIDGQGSKFKLPKFGIAMPKISAPEIDLSLSKKDVEVTLPEAKVEGKLPDVEVKAPSVEAEFRAPEIKVETKTKEGSPSKLKMPTFKLPKFGVSIPEAEIKTDGADVTVSVPQKDIDLPEVKAEVHLPELEVKAPSGEVVIEQPSDLEIDAKFKKPRFSLPRFSFSKQSAHAPEIDVNAPEVDIPQPEGKVEVKGEIDVKAPEIESQIDGQGSKFKLPKFGIAMPKISAPEIDLSLSKKDVEVTLPEAKVAAKVPDVEVKAPSIEAEIKAPEIKAETKTKEGSPSKLKMPTFKLPKFGVSIPEAEIKTDGADVTVSVPQKDIDLPEVKAEVQLPDVDVKAPSGEVVIEQPSGLEIDAKFKKPKFSLPRFSFSKQSVQAPEVDVSAPEVNIPQPECKVEVKGEIDVRAPELEAQTDGQGSKFKLPKFGIAMPKISAPEIDLSLSKKDVEVTLPEAKVEGKLPDVDANAPSVEVEIKAPEIKVETKTKEGSPSKLKMPTFKLPKFGVSIPEAEIKTDGADVTVSVPQKDIDLPEVKAEVHLPELEVKAPSGEVVIEQPSDLEIDAKFKKPRFSLPRFSFSKQSAHAPEIDVSAPEVDIPQPEGKVEVKGEIDVKAPEIEFQIDGQGSKFKLPKFGIAMPKISAPEIDLSVSKKDVEVTLPEAKVEAKVPDVEVKAPSIEAEMKAPEIKVETKTKEGSPSKLKMPTFKLPKFGASIPEAEIKVDRDNVNVSIPEADVDLPEVKAEVQLPELEVKAPSGEVVIEQPSGLEIDAKFKKPRFSLPKFSFSKQSAHAPEVDVSAPEVNIPQPEGKVEVKGEIDVKSPEVETQIEGQGSKFKLPKFGIAVPKISAPEIDLSLSKKDVEVTLPEAKVEGKLSDVEVKAPSVDVEIKSPDIKVETKTKEGSPSKLKMPTFKLPKFGASIPEAEIKVDRADVNISVPQADVDQLKVKGEANLPEVEVKAPSGEVVIEQPSGVEIDAKFKKPKFSLPRFSFSKQSGQAAEVDVSAPEVNISQPEGRVEVKGESDIKSPDLESQIDGQGSKFKLPKFGIVMPKISAPEIDLSLSKKDVDVEVTVPEAKVEGKLPGVELKGPSVETEIKAPEIKAESKQTDGSPSKLKMPTFRLPRFGVTTSSVSADGKEIISDIPKEVLTVQTNSSSVDIKVSEPEGKRSKFKMPSLGFSSPDTDVTIAKKEVQLPDLEIKDSSAKVDIKAPGIESSNVEGSPSKFKMPTFKLPKFGATAQIDVEAPDVDEDIKMDVDIPKKGVEGEKPEAKDEIKESTKMSWSLPRISFSKSSITAPEIDVKLPKADVSISETKTEVQSPEGKEPLGIEVEGQPTSEVDIKMKKPRFSLPKISFSKQNSKESEADVSLPEMDVSLPTVSVEVKQPDVEQKKEGEADAQGSKFKMPTFGISMPKVKGPEIDVSVSKKEPALPDPKADVPETKAQTRNVEESPTKFKMPTLKLPKLGLSVEASDADKKIKNEGPEVETTDKKTTDSVESKNVKKEHTGSKFNFGISMPKVKGPEIDLSLSKREANINSPEADVNATLPEAEESEVSVDAKQKGASWSFPRFSFSKPAADVTFESDVDVKSDLKEVSPPELKVKGPSVAIEDSTAAEPEMKAKFSLPRFSFSKTTVKETTLPENVPAVEVSLSEGEVKIKEPKVTLPDFKVEAKHASVDIKDVSVEVYPPESDTKSKDVGGSPLKFKMPVFKMPKIGIATAVGEESSSKSKETDETLKITKEGDAVVITAATLEAGSPTIDVKTGAALNIKGPSVEIKTDVPKASTPDSETQGSPSKFKLPSFKMPRLSFSKPKPEDEYTSVDSKIDEDQLETELKDESKSPKKALPSFGEILKNIDVEFDVPNIESPKEDQAAETQPETIKKETKQETTKSPERTGWFKFPTFGLSSPTDAAKVQIKEDRKDKKSPVDSTGDEELSLTCSIPSSEAFADISSTMTSENVGFSLSSPTKVTVKYSDPDTAAALGEMHTNVVMSTTKTEVISVEPNLPEKVTILSSGVSSSSEDTVKLESGKIHVITSNIQATPESQQAKLLTSIHVQSAEGISGHESWTVTDSHSSKSTFMQSSIVRETSSESKEVVITKQITRIVKTTEPISDETATSIKQLKDSVHTEKMRFFDGAEK